VSTSPDAALPEEHNAAEQKTAEGSFAAEQDEEIAAVPEPARAGSAPLPENTTQAALPPEAQGETNGGPLGCCLGVMVGLLLSLSVAVLSRFYADPLASVLHVGLSSIVRITMALVAVLAVMVCGYAGWKIGRRLYREYELSPRQVARLKRLEERYSGRRR